MDIMNIYDLILRDFPFAAYSFNTAASTYANIMGVTSAGSPVVYSTGASATAGIAETSMTTGPSKSLIIGGEAAFKIPFPDRFSKENDARAFTLEAWAGFETTGPMQILGHRTKTDGLYFDGDYISMGVDLDGGGSVKASWAVPDKVKVYHIVGVYSNQKVSLYVDGEMVAEQSIPENSRLLTASETDLYASAASGKVLKFEAPAVYYKDLQPHQISEHYEAGREISPAVDNVSRFGGTLYRLSDAERDILMRREVDWYSDGLANNVTATDELTPVYDSTPSSLAGTYTIPIQTADIDSPANVQGIKVEWNGDGNFVVELSINNGTSWTTLTNGAVHTATVNLSGSVVPLVRITFAAGRAPELDIVRGMTITAYSSLTVSSTEGRERTITLTSGTTTSNGWSEPVEDDDASGTLLSSSTQQFTLNESTETDIITVGAVEMWIKWDDSGASQYVFDSRGVTPSNTSFLWLNASRQLAFSGLSAVYVNGVAKTSGSFVPVVDRLYHVVATYATPHNAKIKFGTTTSAKVGYKMLATYPTTLTAAQVSALFKSYYGSPVLAAEDTNAVIVSETAPASKAYVKDWSIQGAG